MKFDLNLTITAIIALVALISPIITALINNHYQSKAKKVEIYELAKRQALTDYISASINYISSKTDVNRSKFFIALNNLYIYFPDINKVDLDKLCSPSHFTNPESYSYSSQNLISTLSEQLKKE